MNRHTLVTVGAALAVNPDGMPTNGAMRFRVETTFTRGSLTVTAGAIMSGAATTIDRRHGAKT